jgi:hypothetical protein
VWVPGLTSVNAALAIVSAAFACVRLGIGGMAEGASLLSGKMKKASRGARLLLNFTLYIQDSRLSGVFRQL